MEESWKWYSLSRSSVVNDFFEKNKNRIKIKVIKHPFKGRITHGLVGAAGGAVLGAGIGTAFAPGIGTGIGAIMGATSGLSVGGATGTSSDAKKIISEELRPLRKSDIRVLPAGSPPPPVYDNLVKKENDNTLRNRKLEGRSLVPWYWLETT